MKAGHSKLGGYNATLPAMRPFPQPPTLAAPPCCLLRFYALIPSPFYPPPNRCKYPLRRIQESRAVDIPAAAPPLPPLNHHMRYSHYLLHSLQPLPSSQHPQHLPSLGYPSLYLLLVKLVKPFCWMLSSSLQWPCYTYLAKNTSHRKWYYPHLPTALKLYFQGRPASYFACAF